MMTGEAHRLGRWGQLVAGLVLALAFAAPYLVFRERIAQMPALGYLGLLVGCFICNLAVLVPSRATLLVIAASASLDWPGCALAGGLGAGLGEIAGWCCGRAGWSLDVKLPKRLSRFEPMIRRHDALVVFLLAALPVPFFDAVGIIAGVRRMPLVTFVAMTVLGKVLKFLFTLLAFRIVLPGLAPQLPTPLENIVASVLRTLGIVANGGLS